MIETHYKQNLKNHFALKDDLSLGGVLNVIIGEENCNVPFIDFFFYKSDTTSTNQQFSFAEFLSLYSTKFLLVAQMLVALRSRENIV